MLAQTLPCCWHIWQPTTSILSSLELPRNATAMHLPPDASLRPAFFSHRAQTAGAVQGPKTSKCQSRNSLLRTVLAWGCAIFVRDPEPVPFEVTPRPCKQPPTPDTKCGRRQRAILRPSDHLTWARRHSATRIAHPLSHPARTRGARGRGRRHNPRTPSAWFVRDCCPPPLLGSNTANLGHRIQYLLQATQSCRGVSVSGVGTDSPPPSISVSPLDARFRLWERR